VYSPLPPTTLSSRIGGEHADYEQIGASHVHHLRSVLPGEWTWEGKRVLDFGCGTGRTLAQFTAEAPTAEFWGCDIDEPSIRWATENLSPPFHFLANGEHPPIALPDSHFDLIFGFSVFTHLLDTWADWAIELHRLLVPGGLGVFTFLGEGMIGPVTGHPWDPNRIGMIELDPGRPWAIGGPNALHSEWWLRAHWGRLFTVDDVVPVSDAASRAGHGLFVVRKDERPAAVAAELKRPEPNEPREIASLQFNVELLKERVAEFWSSEQGAMHVEQLALRSEISQLRGSRSWRLTEPLRQLRGLLSRS
jgi:SAM-dependent methyltransferase